jgi:PST family polysaccharide transporter
MPDNSEMRTGAKWLSLSQLTNRGARLLSTFVLARLLAPEDFGLIGLAAACLEILNKIRDMGLGSAYIQRQFESLAEERRAANTTFWLCACLNLLLFAVGFACSHPAGRFFDSPELSAVLQVMLASLLIDIATTMPGLVLRKQLEFRKLAQNEMLQSASYIVVAVALAMAGCGVWSIVIGQIVSRLISAARLIAIAPWRPQVEFDRDLASSLFSFGKFMWSFVILSAIGGAMDKFIIGRYYSTADLGFYTMAFMISTFAATNITGVVNKLTFPIFSRLQAVSDELARNLLAVISTIAIMVLPVSMGLIAVAEPLVLSLLGPKWVPAIDFIGILSIYGLVLALSSCTGPVILAKGKPNMMFYTSIIHHLLKVALLFVLKDFGIPGICFAVLIPLLASSVISLVLVNRYLNLGFLEMLTPIFRPAVAAGVMFMVVRLFLSATTVYSTALDLALAILVGVACYFGASWITNRGPFSEFLKSGVLMLRPAARAAS